MDPLHIALIFLASVLLLAAIIRTIAGRRGRLPYRKRESLLTEAERAFYGVLYTVAGKDYRIFCKVRLADLLWIPRGSRRRQAHLNRILAKHIDFVLCSPASCSPLIAIELDDSSHRAPHRQRRDSFVDAALEAAGLPLLRVPARRSYVAAELAASIRGKVAS